MQRSRLEHIIRASGDVAQDDEIVIIGSQSILGQLPNAPMCLLVSMEADVYPQHNPDLAEAELRDAKRGRISSKIEAMFSS